MSTILIITAVIAAVALLTLALRAPTRRERLTAAALAGLLADHKDHSDECADSETCPQTVARLAVQLADETIKRMEKTS